MANTNMAENIRSLGTPSRLPVVAWSLTGLAACLGIALQVAIPLNRDIAFLVLADVRMLGGASVLGLDTPVQYTLLLASNHFLFMPAAAAVHFLAVPPAIAVKIYVFSLAVLSLVLGARAIAAWARERPAVWLILAIAAFFLFAFPVESFGQRDHVFAILLLPFVIHVVGQAEFGTASGSTWILAAMTAIAVTIKPYFVLVWLPLALYEAARRGDWRHLFNRINGAVIVVGGAFYVWMISFAALSEHGLDGLFTAIRSKRGDYQQSLSDMLLRRYSIVWLLTAAAAVLSWISPAIPRRGGAFLVAAGGAFVAALVQGTGVDYQWYPATVFAGLFVAWLAIMGERRGATATLTTIAIMFAIAVGMRTMAYGNREIGRETVVAALAERLITHASGTPVWIINRDPYPFYPALARTGLVGASRYQSYSFLDAWRRHGPVDTTWVEAVVDGIVADFELHSPRLAILPRRPSAGLDLVIDHPRIRGILAPYIEVEAALGYRFLVRNRP